MIKKILLYGILLLTGLGTGHKVTGQVFPATTNVQLIPPHSLYLSDYYSPTADNLKVRIIFNDTQEPFWEVKLRMRIESNNASIRTKEGYTPPQPITVTPGIPLTLSGSELEDYFDYNHINVQGISVKSLQQNGRLPEGLYTFCFEVLDYNTGKVLSQQSCASAWLKLSDPPRIISPTCGAQLSPLANQHIFQWQLFNTKSPNSMGMEYKLFVYEMLDPKGNPLTALTNGNFLQVFESDYLQAPYFIYDLAAPPLELGKRYVYRVQAIDPEGKTAFKNDGVSEVCAFYYGYPEGGKVKLISPKPGAYYDKSAALEFEWTAPDNKQKGQPVEYLVEIVNKNKSQSGKEAFEQNVPIFRKKLPPTTSDKNQTFTLPPDLLGSEDKYAGGVTAYTGQQQVAQSDIVSFRGTPSRKKVPDSEWECEPCKCKKEVNLDSRVSVVRFKPNTYKLNDITSEIEFKSNCDDDGKPHWAQPSGIGTGTQVVWLKEIDWKDGSKTIESGNLGQGNYNNGFPEHTYNSAGEIPIFIDLYYQVKGKDYMDNHPICCDVKVRVRLRPGEELEPKEDDCLTEAEITYSSDNNEYTFVNASTSDTEPIEVQRWYIEFYPADPDPQLAGSDNTIFDSGSLTTSDNSPATNGNAPTDSNNPIITVEGNIDNVTVDKATGEITVTFEDGTTETITSELDEEGNRKDTQITDAQGSTYTIDGQTGTVTGGDASAPDTTLTPEEADFIVNFAPTDVQQYGFDTQAYNLSGYEQTTIQDQNYVVAWKSVATGSQDVVQATADGENPFPEAVGFKTGTGEVATQPGAHAENKQVTVTGTAPGQQGLTAYVNIQKEGEEPVERTIGQLNVATYDKITHRVVVVPVNEVAAPNQSDIAQALNTIYAPAVAAWEVSIGERFQVETDKISGMDDQESGILASFPQPMRAFNKAFKNSRDIDGQAYYIFLIKGSGSKRKGFMPFKRQMGYIFVDKLNSTPSTSLPTAIAHELAHGAFRLRHPEDELGIPMADNLMHNTNGTTLKKYQWDYIHHPEAMIGWFQEDQESAYTSTSSILIDSKHTRLFDHIYHNNQKYLSKIEEKATDGIDDPPLYLSYTDNEAKKWTMEETGWIHQWQIRVLNEKNMTSRLDKTINAIKNAGNGEKIGEIVLKPKHIYIGKCECNAYEYPIAIYANGSSTHIKDILTKIQVMDMEDLKSVENKDHIYYGEAAIGAAIGAVYVTFKPDYFILAFYEQNVLDPTVIIQIENRSTENTKEKWLTYLEILACNLENKDRKYVAGNVHENSWDGDLDKDYRGGFGLNWMDSKGINNPNNPHHVFGYLKFCFSNACSADGYDPFGNMADEGMILLNNFYLGNGKQLGFGTDTYASENASEDSDFLEMAEKFENAAMDHFKEYGSMDQFLGCKILKENKPYLDDTWYLHTIMGGMAQVTAIIDDISTSDISVTYYLWDHFGAGTKDTDTDLPGLSAMYHLQHNFGSQHDQYYTPFIWYIKVIRD